MKKRLEVPFILFVLFLTACGNLLAEKPLNGTTWSLSQLNKHSLIPGSHIEVEFTNDSLSGFSGCNSFGGSYRTNRNKFSIEDGIATTAMACLTPEGIGEQETEFLKAMQQVEQYHLTGNRLEMRDKIGTLLLVFILQQAESELNLETLMGTRWQVATFEGQTPIPGSQITITFLEKGNIQGFGGCRGFESEYIEIDQGIRVTTIAMNEEPCNDQDLLVQEQNFTDYFTWADHFKMVDETLILVTQRGEQIVFEPLDGSN